MKNLQIILEKPVLVLIDTWWNVNNILNLRFQCIKAVLIDTWWNVNDDPGICLKDDSSF